MTTAADKPDEASTLEPGAFDLESYRIKYDDHTVKYKDVKALIAAVEALRERVAATNNTAADHFNQWVALQERFAALEERAAELDGARIVNENAMNIQRERAEATEAREVELAGVLDTVRPFFEGEHAYDHPDCRQIRTVLAATPAKALERARAKDAFIDLSKILLTRGHLGLAPPTSGSGRKTIADWRKARAKLDALGKEEG